MVSWTNLFLSKHLPPGFVTDTGRAWLSHPFPSRGRNKTRVFLPVTTTVAAPIALATIKVTSPTGPEQTEDRRCLCHAQPLQGPCRGPVPACFNRKPRPTERAVKNVFQLPRKLRQEDHMPEGSRGNLVRPYLKVKILNGLGCSSILKALGLTPGLQEKKKVFPVCTNPLETTS